MAVLAWPYVDGNQWMQSMDAHPWRAIHAMAQSGGNPTPRRGASQPVLRSIPPTFPAIHSIIAIPTNTPFHPTIPVQPFQSNQRTVDKNPQAGAGLRPIQYRSGAAPRRAQDHSATDLGKIWFDPEPIQNRSRIAPGPIQD